MIGAVLCLQFEESELIEEMEQLKAQIDEAVVEISVKKNKRYKKYLDVGDGKTNTSVFLLVLAESAVPCRLN